ncbi:MAG: SMC-Scp complex subunit ScpB [Clostridia bacterium]|nr:SMC-Scp complex subunit ScpB [Clostridia bacterium]
MKINEYASAVEAILFASGEGVSLDRLCLALETDKQTVLDAIDVIKSRYKKADSGIELIKMEDSFQLTTKSKYADVIRKVFELKRSTPLSQAAFEVLAVVAYNQPVTRAYIEQVRGVDCSGVIASLSQKMLIEECGRLDLPGRPLLYRTTENFLRCFSLESIADLPPIPQNDEDNGQMTIDLEETENAKETVEETAQ